MLNGDGSEGDYDTDGLPPDRRLAGSAKKPRCGDKYSDVAARQR